MASAKTWIVTILFAIADGWRRHTTVLMRAVIIVLAILALLKLGDEFRRLLYESGPSGAIDLGLRLDEVHRWFSGLEVYRTDAHAKDPPASMPLLWPFMGWLDLEPARWLWAVTSIPVLIWMVCLIIRESRANSRDERAFAALIFLSMNATGVAIGNGQLILHILPVLVTGMLLLRSSRGELSKDILGAGLILLALVKPSVTAPFIWLTLFLPRRLRPALIVGLGYIAITLFAASFQNQDLSTLIRGWVTNSSEIVGRGYGNVNTWLANLGLQQYDTLASLLVLLALGIWLFLNRERDAWLLIGVTALVARLWMYHRVYDDVLVLLPMITLFRIAKQSRALDIKGVIAGLLLGMIVFTNLFLASWENIPPLLSLVFTGGHTLVWLPLLSFLLIIAWRNDPIATISAVH